MQRALFLFNHDAAHQVAHLAKIAGQMAVNNRTVDVAIAFATPSLRAQIERLIGEPAIGRVTWIELATTGLAGSIARMADHLFPASRLLRLRQYAQAFADCDVIVSSERTFLHLKSHIDREKLPLFAKIPHGAGDRAVTFHKDNAQFDLLLVSGHKFKEEFVAAGVVPERIAIVGYPKFEGIDLDRKPRFFENDLPTFVYNPHFDPHLSSWYDAGPDLLRWFAGEQGQGFNCIFAPHVMLFKKKWHFSLEHRRLRSRPPIPQEAFEARNILIDTGSPRSFDMSYTLGADAYIGDASSQIYEFMARPRAAFFLDPNGAVQSERGHPPLFLKAGPVFRSCPELTAVLPDHQRIADQHRGAQKHLFETTFDITEVPPSARAAAAIARLLHEGN